MTKHDPSNSRLYRVLAAVMTELQEAGEISPRDQGNITYLIKWDSRRRRYFYNVPDWYEQAP